jgi:exonuclease SbcD
MKIIHCADIHLGRRRLEGKLPESDISQALRDIVNHAITEKVDVFLIAGDLFDNPTIDPPTLRSALECLTPLKTAKIPVVAIEGNHDKISLNSVEQSWLTYLSDEGILHLLTIPFNADGPIISPWSEDTRRGSYFDMKGVRFVGAGYLGAGTPRKTKQIVEALDAAVPTVMLLHAGPDYFVGEGGGFSSDDLALIHSKVLYLALGHLHGPRVHDGWACNPGSPENCELRESLNDAKKDGTTNPRGYARIVLDVPAKTISELEILSNARRPCFHIKLDCSPFGNKLKNGMGAIEDAAFKAMQEGGAIAGAVVELHLSGTINLSRVGFDAGTLAVNLESRLELIAVAIDISQINLEGFGLVAGIGNESMSRTEIEQAAILKLVTDESMWGLTANSSDIAALFYELKEGVRTCTDSEVLTEKVLGSPLVEAIRTSKLKSTEQMPEVAVTEGGEL